MEKKAELYSVSGMLEPICILRSALSLRRLSVRAALAGWPGSENNAAMPEDAMTTMSSRANCRGVEAGVRGMP